MILVIVEDALVVVKEVKVDLLAEGFLTDFMAMGSLWAFKTIDPVSTRQFRVTLIYGLTQV